MSLPLQHMNRHFYMDYSYMDHNSRKTNHCSQEDIRKKLGIEHLLDKCRHLDMDLYRMDLLRQIILKNI
jgi:hypothetical protein